MAKAKATKSEIIDLKKKLSKTERVLFGTFSGIVATVLVHPLDVIKVRLQVHEKSYNMRTMARLILKCEGVGSLYAGLSAGVLRQATSTTTRLVVYQALNQELKSIYGLPNTTSLPTKEKVSMGIVAGLLGALAGVPSEVALVRMMADGKNEPCGRCPPRYRYKGVFHALRKIAREDGFLTLWRGGTLTLARSILVSSAQIGVYAEVNTNVGKRKILEGHALHVFTSVVSSFVTSILSLPVDLIKSRYQVSRDRTTQGEILRSILRKKGVLYLWKGLGPYFIRMVIHTITTLVIFERITETLYFKKEET